MDYYKTLSLLLIHQFVKPHATYLLRLVSVNDGWSESLILSCLHVFLTYLFDVVNLFMIKLLILLV